MTQSKPEQIRMGRGKADLAGTIRNARVYYRFTKKEMAKLIGVDQQNYAKWETGQTIPQDNRLPALSRLLGIDLNYLKALRNKAIKDRGKLERRILCGECQCWVADEKREEDTHHYGICRGSGKKTSRCGWCQNGGRGIMRDEHEKGY